MQSASDTAEAAEPSDTAAATDATEPPNAATTTATPTAADDWYDTRWGRIFYWTVLSTTLLRS